MVRANEQTDHRVNGPVLTSRFLVVLDHSGLADSQELHEEEEWFVTPLRWVRITRSRMEGMGGQVRGVKAMEVILTSSSQQRK